MVRCLLPQLAQELFPWGGKPGPVKFNDASLFSLDEQQFPI